MAALSPESGIPVNLIEKQIHDDSGHRDVCPDGESPTGEPGMRIEASASNQVKKAEH